jgi:hypothetical protein
MAPLEDLALQHLRSLEQQPVEPVVEDVGFDGIEVLLELGHDGLQVAGHEAQDRTSGDALPLGKPLRAVPAPRMCRLA